MAYTREKLIILTRNNTLEEIVDIGTHIAIVHANHNAGVTPMNANINTSEQVIRPIVSIIIAVAVLLMPQLPPWLALVALYPFFTALIGWDPFYAVFNALRNRQPSRGIPQRASHGVSG